MKTSENSPKRFYFFIGTEAELIKLYPVLLKLNKQKTPYKIIASGQNNIEESPLLKELGKKSSDIVLFHGNITQTAIGLLSWFFVTLPRGIFKLRHEFGDKKNTILVIHGDTVSTVMGALIGKFYGLKIAHVEAGLRSFNYFLPFPEELDRIIASRFVAIHFAPNDWALTNLKSLSGEKVNTKQNTLYDSMQLILEKPSSHKLLRQLSHKKFFIFIMHRQENIYNKEMSQQFLEGLLHAAEKMTCVFIVHGSTKKALENNPLFRVISSNPNIIVLDRLPYKDFVHVLSASEGIVTDGGSNQEECFYLGKPCLILRSVTERIEGLKENVILESNPQFIHTFLQTYTRYKREKLTVKDHPSDIIATYLLQNV